MHDAGSRIVVQELKAYGIKVKVKTVGGGAPPQNGSNLMFHASPMCSPQEDSSVPSFVSKACQYLMCHINTEGLFRKPGSFTRMKVLKERMARGDVTVEGAVASDVACLLKRFFRDLPEPLLPQELHSALCQAQRLEILADRIYATLLLVRLLPPANILLLRYLMVFLKAVAARSHENRMDEANLATVFAPNLMHSGRQEERPLVSVDEQTLRLQARVVRTLIEYADSIGEVPQLGHGSTPSLSSTLVAGTPRPLGTNGLRSVVRRSCRRRSLNDVVSGAIGKLKPSLVNMIPTEVRNGTPRLSKRKRKGSEEVLLNQSSSGKKRFRKDFVPGFLDYAPSPNIPATPDAWRGIPHGNAACSVDVLCPSEVQVLRIPKNCVDVLSTPSLSKRTRLRLGFSAKRRKKARNGHHKKTTPHIVAIEKVECPTQDAITNVKPRKSLRIRLNQLKNSMEQPVHKTKCELPLQGSMSNTTHAIEENVGRRLANCALHDGLDTLIRFPNPKARQCSSSLCKPQGHQSQMMSAASLHPVGAAASSVDVTCDTDTSETSSKSASASAMGTDLESSPYLQNFSVSSNTPLKSCTQRAFLKCDSICLLADRRNNEDSVVPLCSRELHFEKRKDNNSEMLKDIHVGRKNFEEGNVESREATERLKIVGGVRGSSYKIDDARCIQLDEESKMDSKEKRFDAIGIIEEARHVVEEQELKEEYVSSKPGPEFSKRNDTPGNIEKDLNFQKKADCSLMNDLVSSISDLMKDESQVALKQNDVIHTSTFKKRLLLFRSNDDSNTVVGSATAMRVKSRVARRLSCEKQRVCSKVAANVQIYDKLQEQQKSSVRSPDASPCIELPVQERVRTIISLWESGQLEDSQAPDKTPVRSSSRIKVKGAAGVSNSAFIGRIKSHYKDENSFPGYAGIATGTPQTVAQLCPPEVTPNNKEIMKQRHVSETRASTLEDCTNQPQKHQAPNHYPNALTPRKSYSAAPFMRHIEGKPLNGLFVKSGPLMAMPTEQASQL